MHAPETNDVGDDLQINTVKERASCGGRWVSGSLSGHLFEALVFPEHADNPEWEIGDSRISKLWVQRLADKQVVFSWDRGLDIPATTELAREIVDFLAGGLAEAVYDR